MDGAVIASHNTEDMDMNTSLRLVAALAFLLPGIAHANQTLEIPVSAQPEVIQTWGAMCKYIGINGKYFWHCPNGAKVRDHRGCKQIAINGKWQEVCPRR